MTQIFEGRLGLDAFATHVPHLFDVPPGTGMIRVSFSFGPHHPGSGEIPHQLSISVHGPAGARGTRHNNADQSPVISARWASPGYLAGPIEPGVWSVEIDVHRVLPPGMIDYRMEVVCAPEETLPPETLPQSTMRPDPRGPGWYQGDLHGHTLHSDGRMTVQEFLDHALGRGYDFVALTDHNTVSALPELEARAGADILVIGGEELTTFHGHALVLGIRDWQDWRIKDGATMAGTALAQQAAGRLFIIAHPMSVGHPFCTGCAWAYADTWPGPATHVEVWNGPWDDEPMNPLSLRLYHTWLNAGHRMIATTGTDVHRPIPDADRCGRMMVHAEALTEAAILDAIKAGRCYITSGPRLGFEASGPQGVAGMGEGLPSGPVSLRATWDGAGGLEARLIVDGACAARVPCDGAADLVRDLDLAGRHWALIELRDGADSLHAMSNPVFVGEWAKRG